MERNDPHAARDPQSPPLRPRIAAVLEPGVVGPSAQVESAAPLYALMDSGELLVSVDRAASWTARALLPSYDPVGLVAHGRAGDLLLATRRGVVHRSIDGGTGWTAVGSVPVDDASDLIACPDRSILLLTREIAFRSRDAGVSFKALAAFPAGDFLSAAIAPRGEIFAMDRSGIIVRGALEKAPWALVCRLPTLPVVALRSWRLALIVLSATGELLLSRDSATTWVYGTALEGSPWVDLAGDAEALYAVSASGRVATSSDGVRWHDCAPLGKPGVLVLGVDSRSGPPTATG